MSRQLGLSFWSDLGDLVGAVRRAMGVTLLNLFRKPVTVHYPEVKRVYPDRFRGVLALTYDKETGEENCIGCRLCEYICPPQVIKVEMLKAEKRNFAKVFTLELYACEFCELCVQVCPTDAIIMMKSFDLATSDRRELLLDKDRLHTIGLQFEPSWATGTGLRDMQTPPKAAPAEHAKAEAPAAAAAAKTPATSSAIRRPRRVTLDVAAFWGLAVLLIGSALSVVLTKNLFHSVLWLALSLTATAGVFLALDAEFLAAVQLLLYAGGVVTIVVFAIVTTERLIGSRMSQVSRHLVTGAILSGALLFAAAAHSPRRRPARGAPGHRGGRDAGPRPRAHDGVRPALRAPRRPPPRGAARRAVLRPARGMSMPSAGRPNAPTGEGGLVGWVSMPTSCWPRCSSPSASSA